MNICFYSLVVAVSLAVSSPVMAQKAELVEQDANDFVYALAQCKALDTQIRAALINPKKQMQLLCGKTSGNAEVWAYRFAGKSYDALARDMELHTLKNCYIKQLYSAVKGRSYIYMDSSEKQLSQVALASRLYRSDKLMGNVIRAAKSAFSGLPSSKSIDNIDKDIIQRAEMNVAAMIAKDQPALACK